MLMSGLLERYAGMFGRLEFDAMKRSQGSQMLKETDGRLLLARSDRRARRVSDASDERQLVLYFR
jgi:hypothetical protein